MNHKHTNNLSVRNLCLVLGDQLSADISSLIDFDPNHDLVLMCEVMNEASYVKHHKKKIAFLFSAMRHFANELSDKGYRVLYLHLDQTGSDGSFSTVVRKIIDEHHPRKIIVTEPGEYRVLQELNSWKSDFQIEVEIRDDDRFYASHQDFEKWAQDRQQLTMEYFYRGLRKRHNILMENNTPIGGQWNFDKDNRKPLKSNLFIPRHFKVEPDQITNEVLDLVSKRFSNHFGDLEPFHFAVTRHQALLALDHFISERLPLFGDYQDAMIQNEPWMYHSHISFYINCGLLNPRECVLKASEAYHNNHAPINAVEGFIRQILGWREYVRGIYWLKMPEYESLNFFEHNRPLPSFFWDDSTEMNCVRQCVKETKENAYAHHIQRLMVLGNFTLIAGIDPDEVNDWYLSVYADAYQWVELPNVTGMILFADGGVLGTKPYAASGAYINKMSNYCDSCSYNVKEKNGISACPFNYLYWNFLIENKDKLQQNHRMRMIYNTLSKMSDEKINMIKEDSKIFLQQI